MSSRSGSDVGDKGGTDSGGSSSKGPSRATTPSLNGSVSRQASVAQSQMPSTSGEDVSSDGNFTDPAADPRKMRRIIAEDPTWNMAGVAPLVQLCLQVLVDNYEAQHGPGGAYEKNPVLNQVGPEFGNKLVNKLSTTVPLATVAGLDNEGYWRRRAESIPSWTPCIVKEHGNSWKQLFFEKHMQELLQAAQPEQEAEIMDSPGGLLDQAALASAFVTGLDIKQLLPPANQEPEEPVMIPPPLDEDGGDDTVDDADDASPNADDDDDTNNDHIDIVPVLKTLKNLRHLKLCYVVKNCGMNFKWSMFGMTSGDCSTLFRGIRDYTSLSSLQIHRSLIGDHKTRMLCKYLLGNKTILRLDLAHNAIGCSGARALAKLMNNSVLEEVDFHDNKIGDVGAKALGRALRGSTRIKSVNVRLNRFGDAGGKHFFKGIAGNDSIEELNVGSNSMGAPVIEWLCGYVDHNTALMHLDITCNALGEQAGRRLLEALDGNVALRSLDIRLTKFDKDTEYQISVILKENMQKHTQLVQSSLS
eukprot:m.949419 g.949419  ORF g.949419 m.949419 type:complete len:530 (+) comp23852_c0_seq3:209-1798(+)